MQMLARPLMYLTYTAKNSLIRLGNHRTQLLYANRLAYRQQ